MPTRSAAAHQTLPLIKAAPVVHAAGQLHLKFTRYAHYVVRQLDLPVLIFRHADSHLSLVDLPWPLEGGVHEDRQRGTADETRTPERQNPGTSGRPRRHECPHRPQV